jgi:adenylate cyclase
LGRLTNRIFSWLDATLAALGDGFIRAWTRVERGYKRPFSQFSAWLKFAFFPLLALGALVWLAWDWTHGQSLNSAEDAIFDQVVNWRPVEPRPSGRTVVVEIDECSSEYFRASRERYADLLDGINVRGYEKPRAYGMRE